MLVRKGLLTNEEVLEEIKAVRREMEGRRDGGCGGEGLLAQGVAGRGYYLSKQITANRSSASR